MTAICTFDVFSSLEGFGSYDGGDWGGYWAKQAPEFLAHRLAVISEEQRMVLGGQHLSGVPADPGPDTGRGARPGELPDADHADDGGVHDTHGPPE